VDDGKNTFGIDGQYVAYYKDSVTGKYVSASAATTGTEKGFVDILLNDKIVSIGSVTIPGKGSLLVSGSYTNLLVNNGTNPYIVRAYDKNGFVYTSPELTIKDTTGPVLGTIVGETPEWVDTNIPTGAAIIEGRFEVKLSGFVSLLNSITTSDTETLGVIVQDSTVELLGSVGTVGGIRRYSGAANGTNTANVYETAANLPKGISFAVDYADGTNHTEIVLKVTTTVNSTPNTWVPGSIVAGDYIELTGIKDASGNTGYWIDGAQYDTVRIVFE
jgi:hypothetical protein